MDDGDDNDNSGSGSGQEEEQDNGLSLVFLIGVPLGGVLLLCIPFCIALRSQACLCRTKDSKPTLVSEHVEVYKDQ